MRLLHYYDYIYLFENLNDAVIYDTTCIINKLGHCISEFLGADNNSLNWYCSCLLDI